MAAAGSKDPMALSVSTQNRPIRVRSISLGVWYGMILFGKSLVLKSAKITYLICFCCYFLSFVFYCVLMSGAKPPCSFMFLYSPWLYLLEDGSYSIFVFENISNQCIKLFALVLWGQLCRFETMDSVSLHTVPSDAKGENYFLQKSPPFLSTI